MIFNLNKLWKTNRRASAKAVLQLVVRELNKGDEASKELWDILSALRGPDVIGCAGIKYETTARIRGAIGLKHVDYANVDNGAIYYDPEQLVERAGRHFARHVEDAKMALESLGYIKSRNQQLNEAIKDLDNL